jgi:Cdc6-like AAA superfamily ATPase
VPRAIFAYGGTGSGKTFLIKKTILDNLEEIKKHIPGFDYIYIDLQRESVPSFFSAIFNINMQLEKYLPTTSNSFGWLEKIPTRGWGKREHFIFMKEIIKKQKLCLVIIIDEVDRLIDFEKDSNFIHCFADFYKDFENEMFAGVCPIFISNKIHLLERLPQETKDRIPHKLHFKPYGISELYQILKVTSKYALENNTYTDKLLLDVAKEINDSTKSAREAKLLLHYNITEKNSEKAREKTDMDLIAEEIKLYSFHQKIALVSVLKKHNSIERMNTSKNKDRYRKQDKTPNTQAIYNIYLKVCEKANEKPKSYRQFHRLIHPMIKNGILLADRKSGGETRGMSNLIYLGEDYKILESILKQEIQTTVT